MTTSFQLATYRVAARVAARLPLGSAAAASLGGRRDAVARWVAWARRAPRAGPRVWVHAASVGEALTAEPVIHRMGAARPELQVVLTYTSPALACWPEALPAAVADYAPPEDRGAATTVVTALAPDLLVFSRTDLWPELLDAAHRRGVPVAVLGGTVRPRSLRLAWPARWFLRQLMDPIRFVGAVTAEDAARWKRLGVPGTAVSVTGDPRHDQILERSTNVARVRDLLVWAGADPTLVAGSVEETDERLVLSAFATVHRDRPRVRLLIVPHETARSSTERLLRHAAGAGVPAALWRGGAAPPDLPCLVVEEVGRLADLYLLGTIAYVGGGFRRGGLHAVVEPAAYAVPVVMGPRSLSADAERLLAGGGAMALPARDAASALAARWREWTDDSPARGRAGLAARVALHQGAARLTANRLLELLRGV